MADTQIVVGMNVDGVVSGTEKAKRKISELGTSTRAASAEAGAGIAAIGNGGDAAAKKVESATRSMIGSIQRQIAATQAGDKASRQYQEALAQMRGVSPTVLKPYLDQLDAAKAKAAAAAATNATFSSSFDTLKIAAIGAAATVGAVALAAKKVIDGIDALNDLKDATGASIENLSALEDVALRTGTSWDTLSTGLIKFNGILKDAKPGSDAARSLEPW